MSRTRPLRAASWAGFHPRRQGRQNRKSILNSGSSWGADPPQTRPNQANKCHALSQLQYLVYPTGPTPMIPGSCCGTGGRTLIHGSPPNQSSTYSPCYPGSSVPLTYQSPSLFPSGFGQSSRRARLSHVHVIDGSSCAGPPEDSHKRLVPASRHTISTPRPGPVLAPTGFVQPPRIPIKTAKTGISKELIHRPWRFSRCQTYMCGSPNSWLSGGIEMKSSKILKSGGGLPPCVKGLPLAWDWRARRIDDKSLREFAKYIHWMMQCEPDQAGKDVLNLLRELVEKARFENG
jgi:hypothetical protein